MEMVLITRTELNSVIADAAMRAAEIAIRHMPKNRPVHYTKKDAAEELRMSRPTLDKIIKAGGVRLNECGKVPAAEIDRLIAARSSS